ncbi:Uncharacterised protein [Mycobacteroides abscessus subsp. abscessus]|nr:Uncharacterised protein [Mycobacteroides abscessus subsp. abscessus]
MWYRNTALVPTIRMEKPQSAVGAALEATSVKMLPVLRRP